MNDTKQIVGAIILAGAMIAGAILIKGSPVPLPANSVNNPSVSAPAEISQKDKSLGNQKAKVALLLYEDYQCPFCGAVSGLEDNSEVVQYLKTKMDPNWAPFMPVVKEYVDREELLFVYRDFPFLGAESFQSAEAAQCAGDQGKFWEYHDYLFSHQQGENKGAFSDANLKSFAKILGLDSASFDSCLDSNKYEQTVIDSKNEASQAGVTGTPKGFILKKGKVVSTIDGAETADTVRQKIEAALK